ncbi:hypothetical protein F8388_010167, partial [Cannabis sativa]
MADSYVGIEEVLNEYCVADVVEAPLRLPTLGMEFSSEDDARNFYNAYAKEIGFSVRVNSYYRSKKDNSIISREFCCSKEGFRRDRRAKRKGSGSDLDTVCNGVKRRRCRPITREGCKALMTVRKRDDGKWFVAKLEKEHNHELVTPTMRQFLRSHKLECDQNKSLSDSIGSPTLSISSSLNGLADEDEEGMASDFIFKVALNALREARIKIVGAKKNVIHTPKLETMVSSP